MVAASVVGIRATLNWSSDTDAMVSETPSMAIEPLGIRYGCDRLDGVKCHHVVAVDAPDTGDAVDVALDHVAVQAVAGPQAALEVDAVAGLQAPKRAAARVSPTTSNSMFGGRCG